jgi:hypothetical protein
MGFATYPAMAGPAIQLSGLTRKRAAALILTTDRIDGQTALQWGMVNECVEPERLLPRTHALAQQISRFDAAALEESKRALDRIPAFINNWREAMNHGQMVNQMIRGKTSAQAEGGARSGQAVAQSHIMLHESLGKKSIDCTRVLVANDADHGGPRLGSQRRRLRRLGNARSCLWGGVPAVHHRPPVNSLIALKLTLATRRGLYARGEPGISP